MDKTININLGGTLFQIDDEAFKILRDYLQAINTRLRNVQGGNETIEDIESRIAEIFQSQKGLAGVLTTENVNEMISIIGKPEDFDINEDSTEQPNYSSQKRRLFRNPNDSVISGVCGGIGSYLNTDPVLFRILFVISALFFGSGIFIYLVLWIAVPLARTEDIRRESKGNSYLPKQPVTRSYSGTPVEARQNYNSDYNSTSNTGSAFNEIFSLIGKVFYIVLRIFLIGIGVTLVLTGFLTIVSFIMIFIFKYPGAFSTDELEVSLIYFPDFLNYIVNPAITPWIIVLTIIALALPMMAMIYWGVKMIFWFKSRDGVLSLIALVVWVMCITALSIMLFNEGISFAETSKTSYQEMIPNSPATLYLRSYNKISIDKFDKELSIKEEGYSVYINEEAKELYIRPYLNINSSDDNEASIEVRKRSSGRSELDALRKTESLSYNYRISGDTIFLDEYFIISAERKWSADNIGITLNLPEGTIVDLDRETGNLFHDRNYNRHDSSFGSNIWESGNRSFVLTDDGLKPKGREVMNR